MYRVMVTDTRTNQTDIHQSDRCGAPLTKDEAEATARRLNSSADATVRFWVEPF